MRALATVETITAINPIPDADAIEAATVRGWQVVVKKGEFVPGDKVCFFEVDSMLDVTDPRFEFLAPRGIRTDAEGVQGHVLKTVRLRGQISQGLVVALNEFPEFEGYNVGDDVTEELGIRKWEPPVPAQLSGQVRGRRPSWIPKTDEERVQNLDWVFDIDHADWICTEKLDGSSTSIWVTPDDRGVSSRNLDMKQDENNTFWKVAIREGIHDLLESVFPGSNAVLQGEVFGEGVQKNPLGMKGQHFRAFNLIVDDCIYPYSAIPMQFREMWVPVHDLAYPESLEVALADVDKLDSLITPGRQAEGVVWRSANNPYVKVGEHQERASWKVISNSYILKHDR